jgi:hypothetical protein
MPRADGVAEAEAHQIERWREAVCGRLSERTEQLLSDVLRGIYALGRAHLEADEDTLLKQRGIDEPRSSELVLFLPSAAARVMLRDKMEFTDSYLLANPQAQRGRICRYENTPVFLAAVEVMRHLHEAQVARDYLEPLLEQSAEKKTYDGLLEKGAQRIRMSRVAHMTRLPIEDGEPLDELLKKLAPAPAAPHAPLACRPAKKPWWKLW